MLTILNRRELLVTLSMERQAEVRRILAENGIDYFSAARAGRGI